MQHSEKTAIEVGIGKEVQLKQSMQSLQLDPKYICMKVEIVLQNAASELLWPLNVFHNLSESKLKYLISILLNIVDDRNILKSLSIHVNPWLIQVNVWQKPLQYCKVISLQLIKINEKKVI